MIHRVTPRLPFCIAVLAAVPSRSIPEATAPRLPRARVCRSFGAGWQIGKVTSDIHI
jgi:hypothetical protein